MTQPQFDSRTGRYDLPLLFTGQAQKEVFVNEAICRIDALLHLAVEGTQSDPPGAPLEGQTWIVDTGATGAWSGMDGHLAAWQAGNWIFVQPRPGMRAFVISTAASMHFTDGWNAVLRPPLPSGGSVVDAEARSAIEQIIGALAQYGIFSD